MIFGIGGEKIQSSSKLTKPFLNYSENRPWGRFENILEEKNFLVKKLTVNAKQKISLQYHNNRTEHWVVISGKGKISISDEEFLAEEGSYFFINKKEVHRIENIYNDPFIIVEVQIGDKISEEDIVRLEDIYERNENF